MDKIIKKIVQITIFAVMFGAFCFNNIQTAHASDVSNSSTGKVCNPVTIEICSICGGDYSGCEHQRDTVYNATICSPSQQGICTICGEAFESCSHSYGTIYGGTECTTYERCNICGNNYNDSNVCSHQRDAGYGGAVCSTSTITICNICGGNYYGCPHSAGECYDEGQYSPCDYRICSICGNNYDDGSACSHIEGLMYNQMICTTTEICNICGGDYSSCSHQKGTIYGGSTCSYYEGRICNICGHNYDDGNVCSHVEGNGYGGTVCTTTGIRFCNICGNNYEDVRVCSHSDGTTYYEGLGTIKLEDFLSSYGYSMVKYRCEDIYATKDGVLYKVNIPPATAIIYEGCYLYVSNTYGITFTSQGDISYYNDKYNHQYIYVDSTYCTEWWESNKRDLGNGHSVSDCTIKVRCDVSMNADFFIEISVKKHFFSNINLSVYESENGGFHVNPLSAYVGKRMSFLEFRKDTTCYMIDDMHALNYAHRFDKWYDYGKLTVNVGLDLATVCTLGAGAAASTSAKALGVSFVKSIVPTTAEEGIKFTLIEGGEALGDYWVYSSYPQDDFSKTLTGMLPLVGTYYAIVDASSNEPLKGLFKPI